MIEQIALAVVSASGDMLRVENNEQLEMRIETAIADLFTEICRTNNNLGDEDVKISEKFFFAMNL